MTSLAVLGPQGTYTEAAALQYDPTAEIMHEPTFTAAVEAVERGTADRAVCAMENSLQGAVTETLDLLLRTETTLQICAEIVLPIRHALVAHPDTTVAEATIVYSHPQALAQTRATVARIAPGARPVAALSTARAIESALAEPGTLAVGSHLAAQQQGGVIVADDVSDEPGNVTRFVVIARQDSARSGDDKTSIAFTTHADGPGSLVEVLSHLAAKGLNMTRIESRPTRLELGTYVFVVDFLGHREDQDVAEALREMDTVTPWLRVLGSYPRAAEPVTGSAARSGTR